MGFGLRSLATGLALMCASVVFGQENGQYTVHSWDDFETQVLSKSLLLGHFASDERAFTRPYAELTDMPGLVSDGAMLQVGNRGLFFQPQPKLNHLSVFSRMSLDRSRLGEKGRALYQADFYLPEAGKPLPNVALLAAVPSADGKLSYSFYRFGVKAGGENVFFSFSNNGPEPVIFQQEELVRLQLRRPGWHRFQIIFQGQEEIYCAVDGNYTSFSPIKDKTLQKLNAGLMVTATPKEPTASCLVDNLSIQWTAVDAALPISPWASPTPTAGGVAEAGGAKPLLDDDKLWTTDPAVAWRQAKSEGKPVLTLFFVPNLSPYRYLQTIIPNDQPARDLLDKYVLLKVDANQLYGGALAQRYRVMRIPTFMVIGTDGQMVKQVVVENNKSQWSDLVASLQ